MKHLLLAALVLLAGCASPVVLTTNTAPSNLAPGQTRLVFQTSTSRALLSDAGFLTLALQALPAGETRYAAVPRAADGAYSLVLEGLTAGDWQLSVRLYPTSEDPTLLFFADQREYLAPGTSNTIALKVYEPGTISGLVPTEAIVPTAIEVKNFNTAQPWSGPQTLAVGLPLRLAATLVDATAQTATDQRVEWSTSNPAAVTISPSGRVLPLQPGQATLTAVSVANRNLSVSFNVTVESSVVGYWKAADGTIVKIVPSAVGSTHRISFVRPGQTSYQYETGPLSATGIDQYSVLLNNQYSLSLAGMDTGPGYGGSLRDNRNGTLSISGANMPSNSVFTRIVDPKPVTSVVVDVSDPSHLLASVLPADATIPSLLWASATPATATINPLTGVVTPVSAGPVSFVVVSLEAPQTLRQTWSTAAQGWLPSVILSGPTTVESNPLATFLIEANLPLATQTQWLIDGLVVETRPGSLAPLVFNTTNLAAGKHTATAKVTSGGQVYDSAPWTFTVGKLMQPRLAAGYHSLLVKPDGTLWAWGSNYDYGQLGDGTTIDRRSPVFIDSNVAQAAVGDIHSLYLKRDGTVWFMGSDYSGQAGNGSSDSSTTTPIQVYSGGVASIAAGDRDSWILLNDGTVLAAGHNNYGALGSMGSGVNDFTQVTSGVAAVYPNQNGGVFLLKTDGTLQIAGHNNSGQLGDGFKADRNLFFPTNFLGLPDPKPDSGTIVSVAAGFSHTIVVTSTGAVWGTGSNALGALGSVDAQGAAVGAESLGFTKLFSPGSGFVQAVAGKDFTVLRKADGTLWASGKNTKGQFGDGSNLDRTAFAPITPVGTSPPSTLLAAAEEALFVLLADGTLSASGSSILGNGNWISQSSPVSISTEAPAPKIYSNGNRSFVILPDGSLKATGSQLYGALGNGVSSATNLDTWVTITPFLAGQTFVSVATGADHTLFLLSNGSLWAVGNNGLGQLGDSSTVTKTTPVQIRSSGVKAIAAGSNFSLILETNGFVSAFGTNSSGQLGLPLVTPYSIVPSLISGVDHAVAIAAGADFGLVLKADGTVYSAGVASGNAHGQAGFAGVQQDTYSVVPGLTQIVALAAGPQFSFALKSDRTLWAAGWNAAGQLGNGTTSDLAAGFTQVWTKVKAVSAGGQHALIHRTDGTLWGTGAANGSGSSSNITSPLFLGEALGMGAGMNNSFVVQPDGSLWWFGADDTGNGIVGAQSPTFVPQRVW